MTNKLTIEIGRKVLTLFLLRCEHKMDKKRNKASEPVAD